MNKEIHTWKCYTKAYGHVRQGRRWGEDGKSDT